MTVLDHLLAAGLVVVFPAYTAWDRPRLVRRIAADPLNARIDMYLWNMRELWGVTAALVAAWWWAGRAVGDLGLRLPDGTAAWWWSALLAVAGIGFLLQQGFEVATSAETRAQVRQQLASQPHRALLPSTSREARVFNGVAVTAGVCEEVLYRGYLLWYFQAFVPGAAAVAAAIAAFGVAHAYQGVRGILATGLAGAVAMAIYLLTGSLLGPVLLHTALDLTSGFAIYRALRTTDAAGAPEPSA